MTTATQAAETARAARRRADMLRTAAIQKAETIADLLAFCDEMTYDQAAVYVGRAMAILGSRDVEAIMEACEAAGIPVEPQAGATAQEQANGIRRVLEVAAAL